MERKVQLKQILIFALPFLASAAMLTLIQAPLNLWPLAWVAIVPFIVACSPQVNTRRLSVVTFIISFFYWLGNLYWIAPITILGWIAMCLYLGVLWPVLALCLRYCRKKKVPLFIAAAVLVVGIERMQGLFLGGFFWRFLAHSQYKNITIIQIADIFGAGGVSFLVAMVNGLFAELIIEARSLMLNTRYLIHDAERSMRIENPESRIQIHSCKFVFIRGFLLCLVVGTAAAAAIVYGRWRIGQEGEFIRPGPMAASLQSNVPQSVKRTFESSDVLFDGLMIQSNAAAQAGAELIVWPETMVQATLNPEVLCLLESSHPWNVFDKALQKHARDTAFILVGAYGGTPKIEGNFDISLIKKFNSAFLYNRNGEKAKEVYNKIHLVPFGEVLPLRRSLSWFYELLMKVKFIPYNFDYSLDYGSNYTVFHMTGEPNEKTPDYKFGVMICYEGTVPYIARRFALDKQNKKQIDWIINISNDGWFVRFKDNKVVPSTELPQHAAVCAFRAVENRLAVLRSVNTGISCLIDSSGRIRDGFPAGTLPSEALARTGMAGWFMDSIPIDRRTSFFSKHGEWLDFCCEGCVFMLIILWLSTKFVRFKKKGKSFIRVYK